MAITRAEYLANLLPTQRRAQLPIMTVTRWAFTRDLPDLPDSYNNVGRFCDIASSDLLAIFAAERGWRVGGRPWQVTAYRGECDGRCGGVCDGGDRLYEMGHVDADYVVGVAHLGVLGNLW